MRIGDEVYVHGYIDEIRYDDTKRVSTIIIRNDGGYFGTVPSEITADRKTEPTISKMEQVDEPKTQTETQNSNLTFEKVMEQTQVIEFPDTHQKFTFARKMEMDGDSIKIGGWEYKGVKDGEREGE